mmetsp:Transcript_29472/g.69312  ORF Transcript_29472/g.69312 Transcript_29472/m.69312 type:complete len:276 (-) Transcript_29472:3287-4114(-)
MRRCPTTSASTVITPGDGANRRWILTVAPSTGEIPSILPVAGVVKPTTTVENWSPATGKPSSNRHGEPFQPEETTPVERRTTRNPTRTWTIPAAARKNPMPSRATTWRNPVRKTTATTKARNRRCHRHRLPSPQRVESTTCANSRPETKPRYLLRNACTRSWRREPRQQRTGFSNPTCDMWFPEPHPRRRPFQRVPKAFCPRPFHREPMDTVLRARNERPPVRTTRRTNWTRTSSSNSYYLMQWVGTCSIFPRLSRNTKMLLLRADYIFPINLLF